ncbi:hypothetical protein Dimus_026923 [Dionaea muscipula]
MDLDTLLQERKEENEKLQTCLTQLEFSRKEAVRTYLGSKECSDKFSETSAFVMLNGFKIGIAQVRELLMEYDEFIPELEKIKINPKVKYDKEPVPSIEGEPTVWSEDFEADPMNFIKAWGIEADIPLNPPPSIKMVRPMPPIIAPGVPLTSASDVPLQAPSATPHSSEQNVPPPNPDVSSGNRV